MDLLLRRRTMMAPPAREEYIIFADPVVGQICATNWGDGVGITPSQAAQVTTIGTTFYNNANITSFKELLYFTGITTLPANAFRYCTNLTTIGIPKNVTSSASTAFGNMSSITSIYIEDLDKFLGITWAAQAAHPFGGNSIHTGTLYLNDVAVTSVSYPSTIASISAYSLLGCSSVTSITVPSSVTSIGTYAFGYCSGVKTLTVNANVSVDNNTFAAAGDGTATLYHAGSVTAVRNGQMDGFKNISIGGSVAVQANNGILSQNSGAETLRIGSLDVSANSYGIARYTPNNLKFIEIGGDVISNGNKIIGQWANTQTNIIVHLGKNGISFDLATTGSGTLFCSLVEKIYVGPGTSQAADQAVLNAYLADAEWSAYASKLDLWSNYNGDYKN